MGSCASTIASTGISCLGFATLLCLTSLFAPFWDSFKPLNVLSNVFTGEDSDLGHTSHGLFMSCSKPYDSNRNCNWIDFDSEQDWRKACMIMWAAGTALLVLCAIAAFFICCESCKTPKYAAFITFGSLFAALLLVGTVVVFAVKSKYAWERDEQRFLDWGYYIALGGSGFALIAFLLFGCSIYCLRK